MYSMGTEGTLKAVNYRLTSTPSLSLPSILPSLQTSVIECQAFIQSSKAHTKNTTEFVVLERYKKLLTSFLTDNKTAQRRWAATVLIKATVDVGGPLILQDSAAWIRGLLSVLNKWQDPPTVKHVAVLALSKVFLLTHGYPSLVRELTTPNLPTFVTACLQNVAFKPNSKPSIQQLKSQRVLTPVVLNVFSQLITKHPTIFRSFEKQLRELLLPLVAPTPSSAHEYQHDVALFDVGSPLQAAAQQLFTLLHFTAPKNGGPQEWNSTITSLIADMHAAADQVFRSILEDWRSSTGVVSTLTGSKAYDGQPGQPATSDPKLGLSSWEGIYAGSERLNGQLALLKCMALSETTGQISFPTARIADLLVRLMLTTTPVPKEPHTNQRHNDNCSREEREAMWSVLPSIHVSALEAVQALCDRFSHELMSVTVLLLDHIQWTLKREGFSPGVRQQAYDTTADLLSLCGRGLRTNQVRQLNEAVKLACYDIVPEPSAPDNNSSKGGSATSQLNTILTPAQSPSHSIIAPPSPLRSSALHFLISFLTHVLPSQTPTALRALIDRTIILANAKDAMMASVVNAPASTTGAGGKVTSSILPFLARQYGGDNDVEGFVRPRLPVVITETGVREEGDGEDVSMGGVNGWGDDGMVEIDGNDKEGEEDMGDRSPLDFGWQEDNRRDGINGKAQESRKRSHEPENHGGGRRPPEPPSPTKRQRTSPPAPDAENRVQPTDTTVAPAAPAPVPVIADTHDDATEGPNVIVESGADVLAPPDAGEAPQQKDVEPTRSAEEKGKGRAVEVSENNERAATGLGNVEGGSDSESEMSIPELVLKSDDSEEEEENGSE